MERARDRDALPHVDEWVDESTAVGEEVRRVDVPVRVGDARVVLVDGDVGESHGKGCHGQQTGNRPPPPAGRARAVGGLHSGDPTIADLAAHFSLEHGVASPPRRRTTLGAATGS
jgi:hypothetical protein